MHVVLIDSPGPGPESHWSAAFADRLGEALGDSGVVIRRLGGRASSPAPVHRVTAGLSDIALEIELTRSLRSEPADVVVHAGVGARGSPNLLWIAARMGSRSVAVVRASEVVCQRGDLVDQEGRQCRTFDEPDRCARCCRRSFFRRSSADEYLSRLDLIVAGLQACSTVWLPDGDDSTWLEQVGVPRRLLQAAPSEELAAAVAAGLREVSARTSAS